MDLFEFELKKSIEYFNIFDKTFAISKAIQENNYVKYKNLIEKENNLNTLFKEENYVNIMHYLQHVSIELCLKSCFKKNIKYEGHSIEKILEKIEETDSETYEKIEKIIEKLNNLYNEDFVKIIKSLYTGGTFGKLRKNKSTINISDLKMDFIEEVLLEIRKINPKKNRKIEKDDFKKFNYVRKILFNIKNKNSDQILFNELIGKNIEEAIFHLGSYSIECIMRAFVIKLNKNTNKTNKHELNIVFNPLENKISEINKILNSKMISELLNVDKMRVLSIEDFIIKNEEIYTNSRYPTKHKINPNHFNYGELYRVFLSFMYLIEIYFDNVIDKMSNDLSCYSNKLILAKIIENKYYIGSDLSTYRKYI
jgi:hypothetical protein